jgi:Flp pilus assembly protein CpaB
MRSRGLVVAIAVVLAVAAAAAVILYTQGVKEDAKQGGELTPVIVATREIPANQQLDPLVAQEVFTQVEVPTSTLVNGAVTNLDELAGATTTSTILANEQISSSRLSTGVQPNRLGISRGHVAVTVDMEAPQGGAGHIQPGDNVSVYATYQNIRLISGNPNQIIPPPTIPTGNTSGSVDVPDFTVTLIPTVRVLSIDNPSVDAETGEQVETDEVRITLDLEPKEAQQLVFAKEVGLVWLGLLPPNEEGPEINASTVPLDLLLTGGKLQ